MPCTLISELKGLQGLRCSYHELLLIQFLWCNLEILVRKCRTVSSSRYVCHVLSALSLLELQGPWLCHELVLHDPVSVVHLRDSCQKMWNCWFF
jgi:hypothetical protein